MKTSFRFLALATVLALAPSVSAASTPVVGTPTEKAAQEIADQIKEAPYKDRAALLTRLKTAETRFDEKLPEWESRKNALPEKERKEAEGYFKELVKQREILRQRIDALDTASAETWTSAKHDTRMALLNALGAYQNLRGRFEQ